MSIPNKEIPKIIGNYKILNTLGSGSFGKVKLGIHLPTSEQVAIKALSKLSIQSSLYKTRILKEIQFLQSIQHTNIIKLFEIIENESWYFLIFEYIQGGELFNLISKKSRLNSNETCLYLYQIINAVEYLHLNKITHRDLKPENILLSSNSSIVKVIDFGLATETSVSSSANNQLSTLCGSVNYSAPEMLKGYKYNGAFVDIWSIGVIAYVMICGYLPFEDPIEQKLVKKITKGRYDFPHFTPFIFRDFIKKALVVNPNNRMTISQMKEHTVYKHGRTMFFRENIIYKENNILNPIIHEEIKKRTVNYLISNNIDKSINQSNINERELDPIYKIVFNKILNTSNWKKFLLQINDKDNNYSNSNENKENEPCSPQDIIRRLRMLNINERFNSFSIRKSNRRNERSSSVNSYKIAISEPNSGIISLNNTISNETSFDNNNNSNTTNHYHEVRSFKTPLPIHKTINLHVMNNNNYNDSKSNKCNLTPKIDKPTQHKLSINKDKLRNEFSSIRTKAISHKHHLTELTPPPLKNSKSQHTTNKKIPLTNIYMTSAKSSHSKIIDSPSVKPMTINILKTSPIPATISISFRDKGTSPSLNTSKHNYNFNETLNTSKAKTTLNHQLTYNKNRGNYYPQILFEANTNRTKGKFFVKTAWYKSTNDKKIK